MTFCLKKNINLLNCHKRDQNIRFEKESHSYFVNNNLNDKYISVTSFIKQWFEEFDANKVIDNMNPNGKYKGKTKNEIINEWKLISEKAIDSGNFIHDSIDIFLSTGILPDLSNRTFEDQQKYQYFDNFIKDFTFIIKPYRTEWCIYDYENKIAGSVDAVFKTNNNKYIILDWKCSKKINKIAFKNDHCSLLPDIPNTNFWHYSLQLNLYKYILDKYYLYISAMYLIVFHESNSNYLVYKVPNLQPQIKYFLKNKKI